LALNADERFREHEIQYPGPDAEDHVSVIAEDETAFTVRALSLRGG
jgi:hypothetical protein